MTIPSAFRHWYDTKRVYKYHCNDLQSNEKFFQYLWKSTSYPLSYVFWYPYRLIQSRKVASKRVWKRKKADFQGRRKNYLWLSKSYPWYLQTCWGLDKSLEANGMVIRRFKKFSWLPTQAIGYFSSLVPPILHFSRNDFQNSRKKCKKIRFLPLSSAPEIFFRDHQDISKVCTVNYSCRRI